jgi:short-subunit dehydrogenase
MKWIVITGGGSGIGRVLVQHFSKDYFVLTCGRRRSALEDTKKDASNPDQVVLVQADLAQSDDRTRLVEALPSNAPLYLLIQNAAIGDPAADLSHVDPTHLEYALQVNVVAPLALVQGFLPNLKLGNGRVLHLGTSVAHQPQKGTLTYGVTKMAFHRLYQQLNCEGIVCGSLSPGLVDTEGVRDHVAKARACQLPHVQYFDHAFQQEKTTPPAQLVEFILDLMQMDNDTFSSKEWRFSEWRESIEIASQAL